MDCTHQVLLGKALCELDALKASKEIDARIASDEIRRLREENARLREKLAKVVEALELGLALAKGELIDFKHYGLKTDDDIFKRIEFALSALRGE